MRRSRRALRGEELRCAFPRWRRRCGLTLCSVLCAALLTARAAAEDWEADGGTDEDAGAPDAGGLSSLLRPEPIVTLPPAEPSPQIAPIVSEPESPSAPPRPVESADRPALLIKTILGLLSLITLAYLGAHPRVLAIERKLGISQMITAGFPFVVLGWIARTPAVGLLNDQLLSELSPLLRVGLGCIGFVAGFRLATSIRPSPALLRTAAFATVVPFACVAILSGLLLLWISGDAPSTALRDPVFLRDALILGTAGAMTGKLSRDVFRSSRTDALLNPILRLEELVGVVALAVIAAYFRPGVAVTWQLPGTAWLLLTLGLGVSLGLIAYLVLNRPQDGPEFVLLTLGLIGFCAGTAGYLRLSPIVIAFIAGTFLALLPDLARQRLSEALRRVERPIYLLSLIVVGALWQIDDWRGWALVPVFTGARLLGKRVGIGLVPRFAGQDLTAEQSRALTIAPIGPLAVAIVVNAQLLYPGGSISPIVAAVIAGGMLTEIVVQLTARRAPTSDDIPLRSNP
jgi:Kef-type K+ transport system membrane component KefB